MSALPAPVEYPHISHDEKDIPFVTGTTMKVVELVMAQRAYGWSPEELHFQHPDLSLGQIHSALAYYWDHRNELDRDIERRTRLANEIRSEVATLASPGSRLAARFARVGLKQEEIPELRDQPPRPADFES